MNLENLDSVVDFIVEKNLIEKGDTVGIGVSGGEDSMALLHFLNSLKKPLGIEIVAVNINHNVRPNSRKDSLFVQKYCSDNKIAYVCHNVDVPSFARQHKMGIEQAARIKRYEGFGLAVKKYKLTKFAVAHHQSDQAETILLHIFRGAGVAGAGGMDLAHTFLSNVENCPLIRPFLETQKADLIAYNYRNQVPHVQDETNEDDKYARNFLRNQIIPMLKKEWRSVEKNIVEFGRSCRSDDDYINGLVNMDALLGDENHVRVPLNFFALRYPMISRILLAALGMLDAREDIEKKHIDMILTLAASGENGSRLDLPNGLYAIKEYEYMAIVRRVASANDNKVYSFKVGKTNFSGFGTIIVTKTISHKDALSRGLMVIDVDKLPRAAKWRTRREGDVFTKFGGGSKTLNAFFIDKKIPARLRDKLPVLAFGKDVFAVAGIEISDRVRTDRETLQAYVLEFVKD
ncbi:MAG: tRNA lysidine(34) synthetase TilS [Christensenellaceae bacterium]|jgi:tRNA(Ile)-lysidine synthase|nr:tRNA lysidine(34) synthetase TilS [Christensenellaceae bacterium]